MMLSWLVVDELSDPMDYFHWILIWIEYLLIFVKINICICMQFWSEPFWADPALASWVIMSLILLWLDNHMTVPFCFITLGWTNMIIRQLDKFLVLVILLKSMEISGFSTKSVKKFRLVCYIAKPFCFRYDIVPKGHCAWTGLYPDGWSEFCSKELAGLRELKISPCSCCYRFGRRCWKKGQEQRHERGLKSECTCWRSWGDRRRR